MARYIDFDSYLVFLQGLAGPYPPLCSGMLSFYLS